MSQITPGLSNSSKTMSMRAKLWFILIIVVIISGLVLYTKHKLSHFSKPATVSQQASSPSAVMATPLTAMPPEADVSTVSATASLDSILLAQIDGLTTQAFFALTYNHDVKAANFLMQRAWLSANELTQTAPNDQLRKNCAQANVALENIQAIDRNVVLGLFAELEKLIAQLPLKTTMAMPQTSASSQSATTSAGIVNQSWDALKSFIVIRHHETPINPLLADPDVRVLKMNIHLLISETRLAYIAHDDVMVANNLVTLQNQLPQYFKIDTQQISQLQELLTALNTQALVTKDSHYQEAQKLLQQMNERIEQSGAASQDKAGQ